MDNLFEIIVVFSVIWSIFSSLKKKNKNTDKPNLHSEKKNSLFEELGALLEENSSDIPGLPPHISQTLFSNLDDSQPDETQPVQEILMYPNPVSELKPEAIHLTKASNPKQEVYKSRIERKPADDLENTLFSKAHDAHFATPSNDHQLLKDVKELESDEIEHPIYAEELLQPEFLGEAILLTEILGKPKAYQK